MEGSIRIGGAGEGDPEVHLGEVDPAVADEFPHLRLYWCAVRSRGGKSPPEVRDRLRTLADRVRGPEAVAMRTKPIPWAYRVFFRHIGLDPDEVRTPVEAAMLRRLRQGGLRPQGLLPDALTLAVLETGVGVWALDLAAAEGVLTIRAAAEGEPLGEAHPLPAGRLVVADARGAVAELFGDPAPGRAATRHTPEVVLFAVAVGAVPDIHVEEALYLAADVIAPA
jgi:DNA/RNA-binding domain of Phe-tRNA-synthetase-like protein